MVREIKLATQETGITAAENLRCGGRRCGGGGGGGRCGGGGGGGRCGGGGGGGRCGGRPRCSVRCRPSCRARCRVARCRR